MSDFFRQSNDMPDSLDFALVGVGGQGIVLASDLLGEIGLALGYDVKKTDSLGMSQRGGSVVSFVRWGQTIHSPLPKMGSVDVLLGLEKLEALRSASYVKEGGLAIVNDHVIVPVSVSSGAAKYPADSELESALSARRIYAHFFPAPQLAEELGNSRVVNVLILGYLAAFLPAAKSVWVETLAGLLPERIRAINLLAFDKGFALGESARVDALALSDTGSATRV